MKRNTLFGGAALLLAGAAIGGGAMISRTAIADDAPAVETDAVTIGMVGTDGTGFQCTFTGTDAQTLIPPPPPIEASGGSVSGAAIRGTGVIDAADGPLPVLDASGGVLTVGVAAGSGEVVVSGVDSDGAAIAAPEIREGTAEECEQLRSTSVMEPTVEG